MKSKFILRLSFLLSLFIVVITADVKAQCAMCRATVEANNQNKESEVGKGLNTGILYLMTIPYLLVGTVGYVYYRYQKKAKAQAAEKQKQNGPL